MLKSVALLLSKNSVLYSKTKLLIQCFFYALDILDGVEFSGADNKLHPYQNPPMGSEQVQARIKSAVEQQSAGVCMI